ncbi:unnamed protein product [Linum trigynum]|uniref:Uncharacterized protein n=1 Tax=Linum trigynum TaxID=586398 RepID=A0AAV2D687_9ROSI
MDQRRERLSGGLVVAGSGVNDGQARGEGQGKQRGSTAECGSAVKEASGGASVDGQTKASNGDGSAEEKQMGSGQTSSVWTRSDRVHSADYCVMG